MNCVESLVRQQQPLLECKAGFSVCKRFGVAQGTKVRKVRLYTKISSHSPAAPSTACSPGHSLGTSGEGRGTPAGDGDGELAMVQGVPSASSPEPHGGTHSTQDEEKAESGEVGREREKAGNEKE